MIEIKNLNFQYGKRAKITSGLFSDFSLHIDDGKIVGLLGKNGAGKSTLLKLVAGLLEPQAGEISVNGYQPFDRHPSFLADISLIPEEFSLPSVSIRKYVKALSPLYPKFDNEKLQKILTEFELLPEENLNRLSHGQRKKFLIAFALASNCQLLILDEPTNGLDIPSKSLFRKVLVNSIGDEQLVVISTHQVHDIEAIIDRMIVIDNGAIAYEEEIADISRHYLFETVPSIDDTQTVVYQEKSPGGYRIIRPNAGEEETAVDFEILFNAIVQQKIKHS
jgi:ABC-2 type transport system ATP-binding protein